jgi:hypothetical protein
VSDGTRDNTDRGQTPTRGQTPRLGRIPDSLIDAVIDGEVDDRARREILAAARRHPQQRRELAETSDLIEALRAPVAMPDLSGAVVAEAHRRRRYLPARVQRLVTRSRMAVAASILLALMSYVGASRAWPDAAVFNTSPAPIATVADSVASDAQRAMTTVSETRASLAPLPTRGSFAAVKIDRTDLRSGASPSDAAFGSGSVAYEEVRVGFFAFPAPAQFPQSTRHEGGFSPTILYVGSSAMTQPQPFRLDRESNLP